MPATAQTVTLTPSAARTASGSTADLEGFTLKTLRAQLQVTAFAGTAPTLDVLIEDSLDGGTTWNTVGTFAQVTTGSARQVINITAPFSDRIRVRWTIGGTTPSFTFNVLAYAQ